MDLNIDISYLDLTRGADWVVFSSIANAVFELLCSSYERHYGTDYHASRIERDNPIVFLAKSNGSLIGVSYIKQTGRRSAIAVAREFRRSGIAKQMILFSQTVIAKQYSIISADNNAMRNLLYSCGFRPCMTPECVKLFESSEQGKITDFSISSDGCAVFSRYSNTRGILTPNLVLYKYGY